jgi:hypothetical protein
MKKLKGPELRMPELRMPRFLVDLFYDLHDRRLLPLVALVIVAILAVPILLGGDSKVIEPPVGSASVSAGSDSQAARLTVVEASPGLRDYHKRLARQKPTNPFRQRFTGPVLKGAKLNPQTTTSTTSTDTTTTSTTTTSTDTTAQSSPPTSKGGDGGDSSSKLTFYTFVIDVKIVRSGGKGSGKEKSPSESVRHGVKPTTPLPGDKAPVVTYMGVKDKASKALFIVSNKVNSVFGDGKCLSGTDVCQLIAVEPGLPQAFVYGANDVRYRINVLKIKPVVTGHS